MGDEQVTSDSLLSQLRTIAVHAQRHCGTVKMTPEQALALVECAQLLNVCRLKGTAFLDLEWFARVDKAIVKLEAL